MLWRIPLLADTPPKPWACVPEDFTGGGCRRVFHGGTMGFARGAPLRLMSIGRGLKGKNRGQIEEELK
jgi:hypothetical protein